MMRLYSVRAATMQDMDILSSHLRPADCQELAALGVTPAEGLRRSFEKSLWVRVGIHNGEIACVWGLGAISLLDGIGGAWSLSTSVVDSSPREFLNTSRQQIDDMLQACPCLMAWVDGRYTATKRWLTRMGFVVVQSRPIGEVPFLLFQRTKD